MPINTQNEMMVAEMTLQFGIPVEILVHDLTLSQKHENVKLCETAAFV